MSNNIKEIKKLESSNDITDIVHRTRQLRKRKKITQKDMAKMTGLTQHEISELETCTRNVSFSKFLIYLKALDIDLQYMIKNEIGDL